MVHYWMTTGGLILAILIEAVLGLLGLGAE